MASFANREAQAFVDAAFLESAGAPEAPLASLSQPGRKRKHLDTQVLHQSTTPLPMHPTLCEDGLQTEHPSLSASSMLLPKPDAYKPLYDARFRGPGSRTPLATLVLVVETSAKFRNAPKQHIAHAFWFVSVVRNHFGKKAVAANGHNRESRLVLPALEHVQGLRGEERKGGDFEMVEIEDRSCGGATSNAATWSRFHERTRRGRFLDLPKITSAAIKSVEFGLELGSSLFRAHFHLPSTKCPPKLGSISSWFMPNQSRRRNSVAG
ncbi:hypothetical protein B0H17DRAFT_1127879 [Mycena rosella]|uniref:Uncharacterized protein n=1 Tax=Mycena rosella TaxID=1033263 RepID=A0AAD7DXV6_MYCRO|nr:hypothetical protein B0H17DRAFT_1127879 [Mycena rosella]